MKSLALTNLEQLTARAKTLVGELNAIGKDLEARLTAGLERAWRLGQVLQEVQWKVGHGNWLRWLAGNLQMSERHARRHVDLAKENPTARRVKDLSEESVRKFRLGYVPAKATKALENDEALEPANDHLTLVNDWRKFTRRVEIGKSALDREEARRDLRPVFTWLCELYELPIPEELAETDAALG